MEKNFQSARGGFSLLEALIAVIIALIIGALAYSQIAYYLTKIKVRDFAEQVYYDLEYARNLAFQKGSSKVVFNPSDYEIYAPSNSTVPIRKVSYPDGITVEPTNPEIPFKRSKLIDLPLPGHVEISKGDIKFKIFYHNASGRIRLEQEN